MIGAITLALRGEMKREEGKQADRKDIWFLVVLDQNGLHIEIGT